MAGVTVVTLAVLFATLVLGDQRRMTVTLANPAPGDAVPATIRELAITFSREPDREAAERAFSLEPEVSGTFRWRGRTLVFAPAEALAPGPHTLQLSPGNLGRAGEPFASYSLAFTVRAAGIAAIAGTGDQQDLVELREGVPPRVMLTAPRIIEFAVAPGGAEIAVVTADQDGRGGLTLVHPDGSPPQPLVQEPTINIGGVAWAPDGSALVVIRRDRLPNGEEGVPRAWLLRRSGEFVAPIDPDGNPSLNASWSPDGQSLAYVSPSDARLIVLNLSTQEGRVIGQPRGGSPAWSADSQLVAFESVPPATTSNPPQPVRVVSLDQTVDRSFGVAGEVRAAPRFWDAETLASLRRRFGSSGGGTELVFESIADGKEIRTISLTGGADLVLDWDLDPGRTRVVYGIRSANQVTVIELDLETGARRTLEIQGVSPKWIP